jgi:methyl-accepting chemotaxis protein
MTEAVPQATPGAGSAGSSARSARWATAARVSAVAGIVVCILLLVATWLGRGALVGAVNDLDATVDSAFARAEAATAGQVTDRLDAAAQSAADLATSASELAANPAPPPDALAGLAAKVGRLADAYRTVRTSYADVRENVTNAVTAVQRVTRFVPGLQAPEGAGDRIQALDAKLQSIDDTLTGIFPSLETGGPTGTIAAAVAERASGLQAALQDASASMAGLSASIDDLHARATNATDSLRTLVTVGTIAITLFLAWILVLNVALWRLGQIWRREAGATGAAASAEPGGGASAVSGAGASAEPGTEVDPAGR